MCRVCLCVRLCVHVSRHRLCPPPAGGADTLFGVSFSSPSLAPPRLSQVNNATARVMTNKKVVSPYPNGETLASLPYGTELFHTFFRNVLYMLPLFFSDH